MKLIKLEIQNLASLDRIGGEIINFEDGALGDSTIFSIVGPTGSGKSTILDAICLALYNRAPRYPRKKGDRNQNIEVFGNLSSEEKCRLAPTDSRNILTRGKKEGYSKLTFLANNGTLYRAEWYVRMKTKKFEDPTLSLYKIDVNNGVPTEDVDDWNRLPLIIGLDYEQFLRTVLIAQGSFANFLTAKENERYELLEKLIGCEELYTNIAKEIKQKKDEAVKAYDLIVANFTAQEKDLIPEEDLCSVKERIDELEKLDKQIKEELQKITEALAWYTTFEKHQQNIVKFEQAFNEAQSQIDAFAEQTYRLSLHDATIPAVALLKDIKTSETNITSLEKTLTELESDILNKENEIKRKEDVELKLLINNAQKASEELEIQKPHINKARQIKTELEALQTTINDKAKAKTEAENAKVKAEKAVTDNRKNIEVAEAVLNKSKDSLIDLQQRTMEEERLLSQKAEDATSSYEEENKKLECCDAAKLQDAQKMAERNLNDLNSAIRIQALLKAKRTEHDKNVCQQKVLTDRNAVISEQLKNYRIEELNKELEILLKSYTLMTSENWTLHRANLSEGEACPLCGATHHPYSDKDAILPIIDDMNTLIDGKRAQINDQQIEKQQLTKEQSRNKGLLDGIGKTIEALRSEILSLSDEWKEIACAHNDWQEAEDMLRSLKPEIDKKVKDSDAELKAYNKQVTLVDKLRKQMDAAEKAKQGYIKTASEKIQTAEKRITEANTLLETEKGKTENLKAQLSDKVAGLSSATTALAEAQQIVEKKLFDFKTEIGDKDPDEFENALNSTKTKADGLVKAKTEAISRLREQLNEVKGSVAATRTQKEKEHNSVNKRKAELSVWLTDYNTVHAENILTEASIAQLLYSTENWEQIRGIQKQLRDVFTSAETTLRNENLAMNEHQQKKPDMQKETLLEKKAELENVSNQELIDTKARLQRHNTAKELMGCMFAQKQEAEVAKHEWEEIADAIGGDGKTLRKIAQCYTLRFLIEHANVEIRKFNSRYELQQVKNSLGIRVVDHDRADDVRDTTSLSGGETFIVSLGLALGLSSLSSRNISFENLFIDEGFGTLDPDTLATVIDSLAMLQSSQGKKVGVISHTDTMSERITTQIRIIKDGNSGSSHIEMSGMTTL